MDSPNMLVVKEAYRLQREVGIEAGLEQLLSRARDDFEFRPYLASGRVLRGPDEVRAFFGGQVAEGKTLSAHPATFEDRGDEIIVTGSVRVERPEGGFAETQVKWVYRFREGLLEEARSGPEAG